MVLNEIHCTMTSLPPKLQSTGFIQKSTVLISLINMLFSCKSVRYFISLLWPCHLKHRDNNYLELTVSNEDFSNNSSHHNKHLLHPCQLNLLHLNEKPSHQS